MQEKVIVDVTDGAGVGNVILLQEDFRQLQAGRVDIHEIQLEVLPLKFFEDERDKISNSDGRLQDPDGFLLGDGEGLHHFGNEGRAGKKSGGLRPVGVGKLCDSAQGRESQVQRILREELFQGLGIGQVIRRDDLVDLKGRERRVCQGICDLFCNGVKNGGRNSLA